MAERKNPNKEMMTGVFMNAEFDISNLMQTTQDAEEIRAFCSGYAYFNNFLEISIEELEMITSDVDCVFNIEGKTKDFLSLMGDYHNNGCPQSLISLFKYAREVGAKWIRVYTND